jgi:plastocyanin
MAMGVSLVVVSACSASAPTASPTTVATAAPGAGSIEVSGVDYRFEGLPGSVPAGTTLTFRNDGEEVHEMVVMRRNDGVSKPFMAILGQGEAAAREEVTVLGATAAPPDQAGPNGITVDQPGDYALVCFIPVGTTPGGSGRPGGTPAGSGPPGAPPHFVRGMITEFTVTE